MAASEVFRENGLSFSGNAKRFYLQSYGELRKDRRTEHLEGRKLNERLSRLILQLLEHKEKFKSPSSLTDRIIDFLEEVIKPEENYQILFKVHNLNAKIDETKFWDCIIANYDKEQLTAWGFDPEKNFVVDPEAFEDQNVIVVSEKGSNIAEVIKRARVKATRRLRVLQNYLKVEFIHDEQLVFKLSNEYAIKRETDSRVFDGADYRHNAIEYDYPKFLVEHIGEANRDFLAMESFPPNLKSLVERALHWIGLSISEVDPDIKIAFLCTALETLLTTKSDRMKGEKIAYRGYLLGEEVNSSLFWIGDFKKPVDLVVKLRDDHTSLSQYLKQQLTPETQRLMDGIKDSDRVPKSLQRTLVEEFNRLLRGPLLYNEDRFAQVELTEETQSFLAQSSQSEDSIYLNRLLLANAYPEEIHKRYKLDSYQAPQEVLRVYNLRSTVVHGSDIDVASIQDYWLILDHAQATLERFVGFVSSNDLTKQTQVYAKLLQSEHVAPLLTWLKTFDDEDSKNISESLKEDQKADDKDVTR